MTKKFVNALAKDGSAAARSRLLVPARDGSARFEEIDTGKLHDVGYLVYTGKEISTDDVVKKWAVANAASNSFRSLIDSYLSEIAGFKVGNVVAIESNSNDRVMLRLVSQTPQHAAGT
jgi:hypothetical protein